MRLRGPGRFLLRNPRRLLAPPELSVAGPASLISGGLLVVSEPPPVPPSLSSTPRLGRPFPETAVMSARLPAPCAPRWWLLLSLLLLGAAPGPRRGAAFYLPGLAPVNFCEEEKKSDECKVGAAWRTTLPSPCPGRNWGPRGRGRSRRGAGVAIRVPPLRSAGPRVGGGSGTASVSGGGRFVEDSVGLGAPQVRRGRVERAGVCASVCVCVCV